MTKYFCVWILSYLLFTVSLSDSSTVLAAHDSLSRYNHFLETEKSDLVVATINEIEITAEEFIANYEYGPAFVKRKKDSKKRYLNYMINEKLLALEGYERGLDTTEQVVGMIQEIHNDIATEELFKEDILQHVNIDEEEIDTLINQKILELEIKWLFVSTKNEVITYLKKLQDGITFDSLFNQQLGDSVYFDERYMKINRYQLEKKNPQLAQIIDTLKAGHVSAPIHTDDGWYLVRLDNVSKNMIISESEQIKLRTESVNALKKRKMDELSDEYVKNLFEKHDPIIRREGFTIVRSYVGNLTLTPEKYDEWELSSKLKNTLENANLNDQDEIGNKTLVDLKNGIITLEEFLSWLFNRIQEIKLNKNNLNDFSISLEKIIWRMARDKLLTDIAFKRGFNKYESVVKQSKWWRDKIVYSAMRNELSNSVIIENKEVGNNINNSENSDATNEEYLRTELSKKIFRLLNELKKTYPISINYDILNDINVSSEEDPKAIDFYTVKKGGLIPRTPYPTIDFDWRNWE